ncbi:glycosyltransferase [Mediterraneibacter sp. 210702-DFI.5.30]|uniref:glycosyltransferase n=1 Tax=Mediterraneibacter sp. 210702-DFI.5.30 TaxID=2883232 RepID=UPI001D06D98E|nr:glycosyltransferase [Mediterraneibacter sp. 210702-DFI.5.30]MCB6622785.1 glycosyltransferase family 4 protein [Mediterraneibacter sp. 210702-DFI.5.30]
MKILYLILLYNGEINGGHTYRMATAKALKNLIGYENLDIVLSELDTSDWGCNVVMRMKSYSSGKEKLRNLLEGNITQRSNKDIDEIVNLINKNQYDIVLFGSSETGKLVSEVKRRCNVKTMTWYHDIVADVIERKKKTEFNLKMLPIWNTEKKAEGTDARLTDVPIVLHRRDADLLQKYWGRKTDVFIPIALEDKFVPYDYSAESEKNEKLQLLFVGAYNWSVNVEAAKWFCENVMSKLNDYAVQFNIAGFQMENLLKDGWVGQYKNVKVLGTVDDLAETYKKADVVVEPILTGSGMKVKTAEALMHGKEVIGTQEALVGYDELSDKVCETAEDFISTIIRYSTNRPARFVPLNRLAYEENYSIKGIENKLRYAISKAEK